jgi:hypothetical protein
LLNVIIELELEHKTLTLGTSDIWEKYKQLLPEGEETGKTSYRSAEFGDMSQKKLNELLQDQFKARPPKHTGNKRELVFDKTVFDRMKEKYGINIKNKSETDESDETDETDVGLDRHISQQNTDNNSSTNIQENDKNSSKNEENEANYNHENADDTSSVSYNASQASQASHVSPNSSNTIDRKNNDPDAYWTRGKWRDYLPPQEENKEKK